MACDFKIVWENKDNTIINSILRAIEENSLNKYSQSNRTNYLELDNKFYFIKGYLKNMEELKIYNEYGYNEVEHFIQFEASSFYVLNLNSTLKYVNELEYIFSKHKKRHNVDPVIPKPIAVLKYSKKFEENYFNYLSNHIRCKSIGIYNYKKMFKKIVSQGICFFVYSYPFLPERIASSKFDLSGLNKKFCGIKKIEYNFSQNIITNFCQFYELGFLFKDFMHHGNALQVQNISTKGTFLDMDSILRLDKIQNPENLLLHNIYYLENELSEVNLNLNIGLNIINNLSFNQNKKSKLIELLNKTKEIKEYAYEV
jgi:hypothetical protein